MTLDDDVREMLREAIELLSDARPQYADPGLRRSWGQRRRYLLDRMYSRLDEAQP